MEEYDKTLLRLEDISFNEIGEWKKTARETSDYLSNGCCIEYLTLILKASLFRSEMSEGNRFPADDINGAVESAVKYITGGDLMNDVATLLQSKNDNSVVFKLTTWAPVVFTFLLVLGSDGNVSNTTTLFGMSESKDVCVGKLLYYWKKTKFIRKISKGQRFEVMEVTLEKLKWNENIIRAHNSFCHSLSWLKSCGKKQDKLIEFLMKTKTYASQGRKGRGNGKPILPTIPQCLQPTKHFRDHHKLSLSCSGKGLSKVFEQTTSLLGKGVIASTKCIEKIGKKLKNTSLTDTHLNEITSSSDSSKNVKEDSVDKRQMEYDRKHLNPVQFRMKYPPIKKIVKQSGQTKIVEKRKRKLPFTSKLVKSKKGKIHGQEKEKLDSSCHRVLIDIKWNRSIPLGGDNEQKYHVIRFQYDLRQERIADLKLKSGPNEHGFTTNLSSSELEALKTPMLQKFIFDMNDTKNLSATINIHNTPVPAVNRKDYSLFAVFLNNKKTQQYGQQPILGEYVERFRTPDALTNCVERYHMPVSVTDNSEENGIIFIEWDTKVPLRDMGDYKAIKGFSYDPRLQEILNYELFVDNGDTHKSQSKEEVTVSPEKIETQVMQQFVNDMNQTSSSILIENSTQNNSLSFSNNVFAIFAEAVIWREGP